MNPLGMCGLKQHFKCMCERVSGKGRGVCSFVGVWKRSHLGFLSAVVTERPRGKGLLRREATGRPFLEEVSFQLGSDNSENGG